ncbi:hypothetical protein niasHT_031613 [Heterodera trifolii]|uniref:Uncharacterized protein n=1 Tax=Heterodera trifolii TaxID=157864 RepID=A0ABD2J5Q1_9BILA
MLHQLWAQYKDSGHSPMLIFTASLLNAIVVPGIFMNIGIFLISFKYKQKLTQPFSVKKAPNLALGKWCRFHYN